MRFSIITPSFRPGPWLRLCIASVADQNVSLEHIVQDAGSDDGTLEWLRHEPRIRLWVEPDQGMYDAINRGLRRATGEICAWLNADEQYLPGALEMVSRYFEQHPEVDVLFGNVIMVDPHGHYLFHRKVEPPRLAHTWTCHLSIYSCGMFFRRRLVDPGGFWLDPTWRCGGDGEWMVRLLRAGIQMAAVDQFTSVFTWTGLNLSRQALAQSEQRRLRQTAPLWMRGLRPWWILTHRFRRWWRGSYRQAPFTFALYTLEDPNHRREQYVSRPVGYWVRHRVNG
ncbi:MAG: glycosyltransferase family 2 protein [Verrucomicrobiota bacterium]|nr:glycosyltransferase family 2 protein [Verrucomicrobiota bacterium]